jgi:hypothetical protein
MYIEDTSTYYVGTVEHIRKARYLILVRPIWDPSIMARAPAPRALVRTIALRQVGHHMVGKARLWGYVIQVSGGFGLNGQPATVPDWLYDRAATIPPELLVKWNQGAGRKRLRAWARNTFPGVPN